METRANHLIVGTFVLATLVALFVFVLWLSRLGGEPDLKTYEIYFTGSVAGLSPAARVRYRGIPVGSVTDISIDPTNSARVRVMVNIEERTPVKTDAIASLEMLGITGVAVVEITGGSEDAPILKPAPGQKYPVIPSRPSNLASLFESLPRLTARLIDLIEDANRILDEENLRAINQTLANIRDLTGALGKEGEGVGRLVREANRAVTELGHMASEMRALVADSKGNLMRVATGAEQALNNTRDLIGNIDGRVGALDAELRTTLTQSRRTLASLEQAAREIEGVVTDNRESVADFTGEGLYELSRFVTEARVLVASLSRIADKLEEDAPRFLFGERGGVKAE